MNTVECLHSEVSGEILRVVRSISIIHKWFNTSLMLRQCDVGHYKIKNKSIIIKNYIIIKVQL